MIECHRDLIVWQKAVKLAGYAHRLTNSLRKSDRELSRVQMMEAAISVGANIADGRVSKPEYVKFLSISRGSLQELDTYFEIATEIGCLETAAVKPARGLVDEISRMEWTLIKRLGTRTLLRRDDHPNQN